MTTPESNLKPAAIVSYPSLTWLIKDGRIVGTADGITAVRQAVEIILNTERYRWQIYKAYSGAEFEALIGNDPGYCAVELQRRAAEALSMDDRITGISDYQYRIDDGVLYAEFTVHTVYGDVEAQTEVNV